ncbi:MAG: glycerol-3-phosphate 1-O-acyltransferase PlsY [Myxococcota bacterium]
MAGPLMTLCAYLLGSVSFGLLAAKRQGVDLRAVGSGNIGATNVGRALGKKTGRWVMVLDMLKGFVPVAIAQYAIHLPWPWITAVGLAAAVGHVFPIWHAFRGGKGAATSGGVLLGALPPVGLATLLTFVIVKRWTRLASVGSLTAATVGAVLTLFLDGRQWPVLLASGLWVLVVFRHAGNIVRLLRGEERIG